MKQRESASEGWGRHIPRATRDVKIPKRAHAFKPRRRQLQDFGSSSNTRRRGEQLPRDVPEHVAVAVVVVVVAACRVSRSFVVASDLRAIIRSTAAQQPMLAGVSPYKQLPARGDGGGVCRAACHACYVTAAQAMDAPGKGPRVAATWWDRWWVGCAERAGNTRGGIRGRTCPSSRTAGSVGVGGGGATMHQHTAATTHIIHTHIIHAHSHGHACRNHG